MVYKIPEIGIKNFKIRMLKYRENFVIIIEHETDIDIQHPQIMEFLEINVFLEN